MSAYPREEQVPNVPKPTTKSTAKSKPVYTQAMHEEVMGKKIIDLRPPQGFAAETATRITALALGVFMLLQPVVGALSDRVGRRPVMIAFGVLGATTTYPLLVALAGTRDPRVAFALALAALVIVSGYTAINAVVKAELFPAHVRALGVALPYALANTLFGGTAEYVALRLKTAGHERVFFVYVSALIAASLVVYARMRETRTEGRIGSIER